jgi:hypothetical protein
MYPPLERRSFWPRFRNLAIVIDRRVAGAEVLAANREG